MERSETAVLFNDVESVDNKAAFYNYLTRPLLIILIINHKPITLATTKRLPLTQKKIGLLGAWEKIMAAPMRIAAVTIPKVS